MSKIEEYKIGSTRIKLTIRHKRVITESRRWYLYNTVSGNCFKTKMKMTIFVNRLVFAAVFTQLFHSSLFGPSYNEIECFPKFLSGY